MKKELLLCVLLFSLFLFLISCAPVSQEELQSQAATQLQNLSDEELAQVEKGISENKPLTGQVYQVGSIAAASRTLNSLPAGSRAAMIRGEVNRRGSVKPCSVNGDCSSSQICGINNAGERVCESGNQPVDFRCEDRDECGEGLLCGYDGVRGLSACLPPVPLGSSCDAGYAECVTGLCGINNDGEQVCEDRNQSVDSRCGSSLECGSGLCSAVWDYDLPGCNEEQPSQACIRGICIERSISPRGGRHSICIDNQNCDSLLCQNLSLGYRQCGY